MLIIFFVLLFATAFCVIAGIVGLLFKKSRYQATQLILCPTFAAIFCFGFMYLVGKLVDRASSLAGWSVMLAMLLAFIGGLVMGGYLGSTLANKINKRLRL
jgi:phosphoglycerol transferase MdoB-like AlkP superfamily enzyme